MTGTRVSSVRALFVPVALEAGYVRVVLAGWVKTLEMGCVSRLGEW